MQRAAESIINFIGSQARKTIRRPSRIILIPYYRWVGPAYYRLVLPVLRPLLGAGISIILWCGRSFGVSFSGTPKIIQSAAADYYFFRGTRMLDRNEPERAWLAFSECLQYSNSHYQFMVAAVCLYAGLGRMREAIELFRQSNRIRLGATIGAGQYDRYCMLDHFWTAHIGHAAQIDYVLKLRMLEGRDPNDTILYLAPGTKVTNRFLVDQWRPYLRLITDPRELPCPEIYAQNLALDFYVPGMTEVGRYYLWELAAQTYRRWAAEGRKPLLRIPAEVRDRGLKALASAGLPPDIWFVGLHVREPQFQTHHRDLHDVLNAEIENYLPALEEITQRGGWVIRMGDPSMTPMPPLPNVLDYCHSAIRSDWMDVFLAATSRFFIGTSSGVCYVAQDYGVPCVLTNWWPPAQRPWHAGDIFLPKLLRRVRDSRALTLEESLNEPFGYCNSESYLRKKQGVVVEDNDPQDIRAAVIEMIERLDGQSNFDASDLAMRAQADIIYATMATRLYDSPGAFGAGVLARDFLRRNPRFVGI